MMTVCLLPSLLSFLVERNRIGLLLKRSITACFLVGGCDWYWEKKKEMEIRHLQRVVSTPQALATAFAGYCKRHQVITRGLCKIGYTQRRPSAAALPQSGAGYLPSKSSDHLLRGLIANKDIKKDENVVMLAERACLHPGRVLKCEPFMKLMPMQVLEEQFHSPQLLRNERLTAGSLIRYHQLLMGLYMAYITLAHRLRPDWASQASALPGGDIIQYLDFLPRSEGDFTVLSQHLSRWMDTAAVVRECEGALASNFQITSAEVRSLLLFSLCMMFSRVVPVDHIGLVEAALKGTPLSGSVKKAARQQQEGSSVELLEEPMSFMCPIIDMCNHSTHENVAVMVPSSNPTAAGPVICLRSLRDIQKGEELTMCYTASDNELRVVWGMPHVLE